MQCVPNQTQPSSRAAAVAAQVGAGNERAWSQPSPLVQQPRTPRAVYFPERQPVLLGGKLCTQRRAGLRILSRTEPKTRPEPERTAVLCLGPLQQHSWGSRAPLQGLPQQASSEQCRETQRCFSQTFSHAGCSQIQELVQTAAQSLALGKSFQAWRYGVGAVPKCCCGKPRVNRFKLFLSAARKAVISSTESNPGAG